MQVLRLGVGAMLAAAVSVSALFANGDDMASMKASMESMKAEMEAMRANIAAERDTLTSNAGGAPEGLRSANGNATIRIGGDVRMQYGMGWSNGYGRAPIDGLARPGQPIKVVDGVAVVTNPNANYTSQSAGWAVNRAQLYFDIDLSCDTSAFIDLRFDGGGAFGQAGNILNQAYWTWKNVGGSGFGLSVGLMNVPFGMWANTDMGGYAWDSVDRALITKPFVMDTAQTGSANSVGGLYNIAAGMNGINPFANGTRNELVNLGIFSSYNWDDQVVLKAGLMASGINGIGRTTAQNNPGVNWDNEMRNIGVVDHVVALGYNPCWMEGLHIEAAYMGRFDGARGQDLFANNPYIQRDYIAGDTTYQPSFDLGISYKVNDKLKLFAEGVMTWSPWLADGGAIALSLGADYKLTEKLMLGLGYDYYTAEITGNWMNTGFGVGANNGHALPNSMHQNIHRASIGGKYDFCNGLYFQMQYYHDFITSTGVNDGEMKSADAILFQTGYIF